ncbi:hypothetical protein O6H91_03G075900 [Diphasiastrum complanatum]|uniref:Uncharacterized protein n=1 Tax=Diphasiastrum complanatum TaxID=34168 RepID=A0ACC2E7V8_DIPCM|nr:hypothetical protein O6H91_03G075900 [Diphasiastrum complanatum]
MGSHPSFSDPITTKKELWGWYLYEASSSGFSGSVLTIFLPLLLVSLATDQAWLQLGALAPLSCVTDTQTNCVVCMPGKGDQLRTATGYAEMQSLRVHAGSVALDPVSYATTALGFSVLFQLIVFISCGPLIDYGNSRKLVLVVSTIVGASACCLCLALYAPWLWWVGGILLITSNVAYGVAYICYNSYLSVLTDGTPEMKKAEADGTSESEQRALRNTIENDISLNGISIGSVLGALCVVVSFSVSLLPGMSNNLILRLACFIGGVWWLIGSLPTFSWLQNRPGPPLQGKITLWLGWQNVWSLICDSQKHKYTFRFLLIYFIFSDGYTTVTQIGVLFGQQELCMSTASLAAVVCLVSFFAIVGNPLFAYIQQKSLWDNNQMLILVLAVMSTVPLYGILGFFAPIGLKHQWELFVFGSWFGMSLGALLSYSRTLFLDLIPVGKEAAMFSLLALSSKGSAWLGPFIVAILVQFTGSLRIAFVYVLAVILVSIFLLHYFIDNKQGLIDAGRLKQVSNDLAMEGDHVSHDITTCQIIPLLR